MFKAEFHDGNADQKPIVTISLKVNNGKKFKELDADGTKALYNCLSCFVDQLEAFMEEIKEANSKCRT